MPIKIQQQLSKEKEITPELIRALIEIVWHFGPKSLDGTCCETLSMPEFIALEKVSGTRNCPVQDIGTRLGFTKSGATRIVNRLEKKGFIKKRKFPHDARVCCITITSKGKQTLDSGGVVCTSKLEQLASKVPVNAQTKIKDTLIAMAKALRE